ncbi:MAG: heme exporter protein CcmB [Magnetococcales bacterium]|nr:heme exporter protein CcmB [Magnetococcales bacterium]
MTLFIRAIYRIAWKDLLGDLRHRSTLASMLFFVVATLVLFQAAFEPDQRQALQLLPGLLWITALFSSMLGLGRVFQAEEEDGALEGLLLAPIPRGAIFLGKWCSNLLLTILVELALVPLTLVLFNVDRWPDVGAMLAILWLGSLGLTGLGVLLAAMTQQARARESLLALLLLPLVTPLLIAGVQAMAALLQQDMALALPWLRLMLVFDLVYLAVAPWAFGWLLQDVGSG